MGAIRDVLRVADCRRIEAGWFASLAGELAGSIALLVHAYNEGGAPLVALYGVARTLPAMVVTPAIVGATDRFAPDSVLRVTVGARAVLLGMAAGGAVIGAPVVVVIGAGVIGSWLAGAYRPIQASVLPWLARTPGELTAANVVAAMAENAGTLLGPVIAGAALGLLGVPAAIAGAAAMVMLGMGMIWRLEVPARGIHDPAIGKHAPMAAMATGAADLARLAPPAGVAVLVFAQTFVRGSLTVLTVVLALEVLLLGEAAVGWLTAAMGIGGLLGGVIAGTALSVRRLARGFLSGLFSGDFRSPSWRWSPIRSSRTGPCSSWALATRWRMFRCIPSCLAPSARGSSDGRSGRWSSPSSPVSDWGPLQRRCSSNGLECSVPSVLSALA